ncbi:MAG: hypothetical protein ACK476_14695 [Fluviicola sp.]
MGQKEIFNLLANGIIDDLPQGLKFKVAILNILRLEGVVEFKSHVIDLNDTIINLEVSMGYKYAKAVLELYTLTQKEFPIHANWNRAVYKLFPDGKMDIEYIGDQELQDQVDRINKD